MAALDGVSPPADVDLAAWRRSYWGAHALDAYVATPLFMQRAQAAGVDTEDRNALQSYAREQAS